MSILLCVSIAWVTFGLLLVGLGLLIVEHFFHTPQVTIDDESISDQAPQMAKLDRAMDEPVQPCDTIPAADGAVADPAQRAGAVIIRDPRLTRARTLSDQSGGGLNATFVFPTVCGGRDTAA
jgi:hypothetical protein